MNAINTSTASTETLAACAQMAAQSPWNMKAIMAEAWVPVMHDGSPCCESPVTGLVSAYATKEEAERSAYNSTCYGGPNTVQRMTLEAVYEKYIKTPGFIGYRMPR